MKKIENVLDYFSREELGLWGCSMFLIIVSYLIFDRSNHLTLIASLLGVTSIIINAKGNPLGQFLMIIFSLVYGYISYTFAYYGEMITYLGMTMPMAAFALIAWLKHPFQGKKTEVEVYQIRKDEVVFMFSMSLLVTIIFYFILTYFHTANIVPSTLSITTSFIAVYLTFKRSPYFSMAYALNDVVLIILWSLASMEDIRYISVVVCFTAFLFNDIYGFISWRLMEKKQLAQSL